MQTPNEIDALALTDPRHLVLQEFAEAMGRACAAHHRQALEAEGRQIAGGWPMTIPEARAWVAGSLVSASSAQTIGALTAAEREFVVRAAYASARNEWSRFALPDER